MAKRLFSTRLFAGSLFDAGLWTGVGPAIAPESDFICGRMRVVPALAGRLTATSGLLGGIYAAPELQGQARSGECSGSC